MSLPELLIALTLTAIITALSVRAYLEFNQATTARRAARLIATDIALTRSYAIERRANVSLVADEKARTYVIRVPGGDTLQWRFYDTDSALPLEVLNIQLDGDSITFNARGMLAGVSPADIQIGGRGRAKTIRTTALGKTRITANSEEVGEVR